MLADFYIPWLSNDMKIAVQKNHLRGQILYISLGPVKKRRQKFWLKIYFLFYIYNVCNVSIKPAIRNHIKLCGSLLPPLLLKHQLNTNYSIKLLGKTNIIRLKI